MNISTRIKSKMEEKNLSINALERKVGIKPSAVQNILYGRSKSPGIDTLLSIAKALECNILDLISDDTQIDSQSTEGLNEDCDICLLFSCIQSLKEILTDENVTLSYKNVIDCLKHSYDYSTFKKSEKADATYTHWLIDKISKKV